MCGRDSSVGIATRYGLDGPGIESRRGGGARFSTSVQTCPGAHPASCTMGAGSFRGVKRPGRGADHAPPSGAEVEGRVELYVCSLSGPSWPVIGRALPLPFYYRVYAACCSAKSNIVSPLMLSQIPTVEFIFFFAIGVIFSYIGINSPVAGLLHGDLI